MNDLVITDADKAGIITTDYDRACALIATVASVDDAADWRNKAAAMREYARQAKNLDLEIQCAQIRSRAERRLGQLIKAQKETVGLHKGGRPSEKTCHDEVQVFPVKLEDAGIDRNLSSRAQRAAEIGDVRFEALMTMMRQRAEEGGRVITDVLKIDRENEQRQARRDLARALSETSRALSPNGQKVPCIYADPAWERKQGVTDRSYENHYDTMTWDEICAMPVKERLLPDAWLFLWIPRAHMFALHTVMVEVTHPGTGEVFEVPMKLPLAWAVAQAWGFEGYSTAFIWTKTDEEHPLDQGGGVIVFDQDEVLLMFKRGRGLPKPATDEKFKSNHRERKREHSRKPEHYRDMIRTMTGGVPVLELFARVDGEHPLPPDWLAWGNQAASELDPDVVLDSGLESSVPVVVGLDLASGPNLHVEVGVELVDGQSHLGEMIYPPSDVSRETSPDLNHPLPLPAKVDALRAHLSPDEFETWSALDALVAGREVSAHLVRGVIGDGYADIGDDEFPVINDDGAKFLYSLEAYASRSECIRTGNMPAWPPLLSSEPRSAAAASEPEQIDLEQLLASAPPVQSSELPL